MDRKPDETWVQHLEADTRSARHIPSAAGDVRVPGLTILGHPDSRRVGERVAIAELSSGKGVSLSRLAPLFSAPGKQVRRPLADPFLSRQPIRLRATGRRGVVLDCEDCKTLLQVDGDAVDAVREIEPGDLERGVVVLLADRVVLLLHLLHPSPPRGVPRFGMVGDAPALLKVRQEVVRVAPLDVPVLLRGETGSGKELVAAAIHQAGGRSSKPYVAVNVGAIPAALAAAELFGAARGAFTGADRRRLGYFSRADGGTLFLDEVGEMPPEVQVLLLRVLESGEIQPVGSEAPSPVDVRVIAATDARLEAEIEAGRFRAPLLHRLSGHEIRIPPLRERRDDVGRLLIHFLRQELAAAGENEHLLDSGEDTPWLSAALVARLAAYSWPGNVRQLRNVARQLVVSNRDLPRAELGPGVEELLRADAAPPEEPAATASAPRRRKFRSGAEVGEDELLAALAANRWRLQPAAADLGISRSVLYSLIDSSPKVKKPRDLSREEIEHARERCGGDMEAMVDELEVSRKGLRRRMTELGLP